MRASDIVVTNAMFRVLVDNLLEGILQVTEDGDITYANSAAEKIFGYVSGELKQKKVESLVPDYERTHHPENRRVFWDNPTPRYMGVGRNVKGKTRNGVEIPLEVGLIPFADAEQISDESRLVWVIVKKIDEPPKENNVQGR